MAKTKVHKATAWDAETGILSVPSLPEDGIAFVEVPVEVGCFSDCKRHVAAWTGGGPGKSVLFAPHGWLTCSRATMGDGWTFID